jgi:putative ABC transport system substrate-binding protein
MSRRHRSLSPRFLTLLAACAAILAASPPATAADAPELPKWFHYSADVTAAWQVMAVPDDPQKVVVRRKGDQGHGEVRRVMVLYPRPSSAYDVAITKMLHVFEGKDMNAEFTAVNFKMDDARGLQAIRFAEDNNVSLIFAMGSESTAWLYDHYRGGAIPVVSVCSKDPVQLGQMADYEHGSGTNFAFTSLNMPIDVQMAYVHELRPDLRNLTVLVDSQNVSAVQTQAEPIAKYARERGVQVIWGAVKDPRNARQELVEIVDDAVRTMHKNDPDFSKSLFWITGSTSVFLEMKTINEHAESVPVVSVVPEVVREGPDTAVMAIGISFESNAHLAAIYGADILARRARVQDLKVGIVSPPDIAVSFLKSREIGLRVPFTFFESASFIYDYDGKAVRTIASKIASEN